MSTEVETKFEGSQKKEGTQSAADITALDLQLQQITSRIQQTTQALSETTLSENNSPSRKSNTDQPSFTSQTRQRQSFV